MCYSAQIEAEYNKFIREFGAYISIRDYVRLYWDRKQGAKIRVPKAMDASFANPKDEDERQIREMIMAFDAEQASKLEQELFKQKKRLADAERTLEAKTTKAANESKRIATDKIEWIKGKLSDLRRAELTDEDSRIFPGWYAPVMVLDNGRRVVKPMRYQCRPAGKPAVNDIKFPGTYNARRDSLGSYWKDLFGYSHGLIIADAFYENVSRHTMERRELATGEKVENVNLEFRPKNHERMLVACLWSHWQEAGEPELLSFAAITDDPPPEVAAAGHDRCIIPIKAENADEWLSPDPKNMTRQYAILDDRERPYYVHRRAA